jgi:prepilin-type N-terminal cleavage/methylation domain-containing protein
MQTNQSGYTLVELLLVIIIISIVIASLPASAQSSWDCMSTSSCGQQDMERNGTLHDQYRPRYDANSHNHGFNDPMNQILRSNEQMSRESDRMRDSLADEYRHYQLLEAIKSINK